MARHGKYPFTLADGRTIRGNFTIRGKWFKASFPDPTRPGKYVEAATGIEVPKGFKDDKDPPADWFRETAKIIAERYSTTAGPGSATWDNVIEELKAENLREKALEPYLSAIRMFRKSVSERIGPCDVTIEIAKAFTQQYQQKGFTRSNAPDATEYPRQPKTVENMVRRMSGIWNKITPKLVTSNPWEQVKRPTVPITVPEVPSEETVNGFFAWLLARYPKWELLRCFIEVKSVTGCRLNDLCQVKASQFNRKAATLTILPDQDKTHRERVVPLDDDLAARLARVAGSVYLWEKYLDDAKVYRPNWKTKRRQEFTPRFLYNSIQGVFREWEPDGDSIRSHGLRKRAITLGSIATGNVDATAQAFGLNPMTARKYYLDAKRAFDGTELLKKMASVLKPSAIAKESPKKESKTGEKEGKEGEALTS
jgi:integrase